MKKLDEPENAYIASLAAMAIVAWLLPGCSPGTVGAIVTAPIAAPVMFLSTRMESRGKFLERARNNDRPGPPLDGKSRRTAQKALEQALRGGAIDQEIQWHNDRDASGHAGGTVTVLAHEDRGNGQVCREVLIETRMKDYPPHPRVNQYCWNGKRWIVVGT